MPRIGKIKETKMVLRVGKIVSPELLAKRRRKNGGKGEAEDKNS